MQDAMLPAAPHGRVVRVHFQCHAALPMGSSLRVTGRTLWAPTSHVPSGDGTLDQEPAFPLATAVVEEDFSASNSFYASSVEMMTCPDTYPLWKTKEPVVLVLRDNSSNKIQHHYYRYLVVTPGAGVPDLGLAAEDSTITPAAVMQWENPFDTNSSASGVASSSSLQDVAHMGSSGDPANAVLRLAKLPFRTLNLSVETGQVLQVVQHQQNQQSNVRPVDTWNHPEDATFQSYQIRETMALEKQLQRQQRVAAKCKDDTPMETQDHDDLPKCHQVAPKILFICYHLPVVLVKDQSNGKWYASWSESLLAQKEGSKIVASYRAHWIGTVTSRSTIEESDKDAIRAVLQDLSCTPLFLDEATRQSMYYGFCKQVLWPAFHNIDLLDLSTSDIGDGLLETKIANSNGQTSDWDQSRLDSWWQAYQDVNQAFATVVNELAESDASTYLWIHDYHLSLLPKYLNKEPALSCAKVFFLHIPFPTSQIFRELECGEALLEGMLHADVVGFHAFDHARHFLNATKRILGLNYESLVGGLIGVNYLNKKVLVSMSNVSIEPRMINAALALPAVSSGLQALKAKHGNRRIICGVDVAQRLSGVSLKLLAFECLLKDYPSWQQKVVMVQRVLIPGSRKQDEQLTLRELRALVQRIQKKYGPQVIDYQEFAGSTLPMDQRMALWKAGDVLMLTPIREGLNEWPMEYVYCKASDAPGVVIASEFSAVNSILNGALRVNPFDIQMTITIIDKALTMDPKEREGRRYRDLDFVNNCPSDKWVRNVLRDLTDATASTSSNKSQSNSNAGTPTTPTTPTLSATPRRRQQHPELQGTAAFLLKESHAAFGRLNPSSLEKTYHRTTNRVIVLDFNGTIVLKEPPGKYLKREILGTSGNKPPPQVLEALTLLCEEKSNTVYVNSGDSVENVLSALGHIPNLGLAVSNGASFSPPLGDHDSERRWKTFDLGVDWDAVKRVALPVLSKYTARSNGSFVKLTTFSIGWSYYSCDPEWGSLQASHLVLELEAELKAFDVRFVTLKGIVEVVPRKLNKGLIVKKLLRDISRTSPPDNPIDFILCLGDDISDEKMFTSVFSFIAEQGGDEDGTNEDPPVILEDGSLEVPPAASPGGKKADPMYCYACAVGKKPSHASMYVHDAQEVARILVRLAKGSSGGASTEPTPMFS